MALVVVGALLGVTACGGDDGSSEPAVVALESAPAGEGRFELTAPEAVEAGLVRLEFRNGTEEGAEAQLLRLDDGHTVEEALEAIAAEDGKIPDWLHAEGGVGQIEAGTTGAVELVLEEDTYHVIDTGEPDGDDVQSHAEQGAVATLEVSGGDDDAELSEVDASIEMADYNFVTEGLTAGTNRLLLSNTGDELHHTLILPVTEGAEFSQVREFMTSDGEGSGPPPVDFTKLKGTTVLDPGRSQIEELELAAGRYAFVCFITDRAGGPPHVEKGMLREVTIEE